MTRQINITTHCWPLTQPFRSAYGRITQVESVRIELTEGPHRGRGECRPFHAYGQDVTRVLSEMGAVTEKLAEGMTRAALQEALPPGSARNAIDCALWDLGAKQAGEPVWRLAGLSAPRPFPQMLFVPAIDPTGAGEIAAEVAAPFAAPLMKVKMPGDNDLERIVEIHRRAPHARIVVDPNGSWTEQDYLNAMPVLARNGVVLVEQPFAPEEDQRLDHLPHPVPLCADESCRDAASLDGLRNRYKCISIKLEKAGGLTEALAVLRRARELRFGVMVSCMISPSLALAPAIILAGEADYPDISVPGGIEGDPQPTLETRDGLCLPPAPELWG
ncbi:dipeptide epimerase [Mesorhizobium sp. NZP2077]|uniref:dipeptide epimerase n=1 Tax=Mesorhizobium sp. NZP2077 TaxID=2483404 RepID=UPI001551DD07|nr:dipeptide epimerase [Mesorhizobium sp. NZP2077]QKC86833.1 dipeptide epimerase [Mesorhizobium sp. NZP2077]QKD20539.1 dipeptide epimerase [Mesorhizobium sp. NZP2077]